ncbi:MAG: sensor domain-containing diguanylate cyclase [Gammaproteobacteria bacterium]|nr:sensor domain-containing diguanylate cyclase [Gammaproteobacteria bacterium]
MPAAEKPSNEHERQRALNSYGLLDTQADDVFNSIIEVAADICEVPISVISLIDDERQFFFARHNMPREQTPRADALCAHAILDYELMEVYDAREDPRFNDSALVTSEPGIRFYAAQPITTPDGYNLGAICLVGHEPKKLDERQREVLARLSRIVISMFEARKSALEQERRLQHLATHDQLCGLPNRALGADRLEQALARARRADNKVGLIFIDMDEFKSINDRYGHSAGDAVIKETASRLRSAVRESDTVARWGGDEFIVVLGDVATREDAIAKREHIRSLFGRPYTVGDQRMNVSASIGFALYPESGKNPDELLVYADHDMYAQKNAPPGLRTSGSN